jgi:NADPH2:quinone reductase|tara:strand:- start:337 stop:1320 length:984 start_codon:yes stop_codon:yes gene_type:complete
MRAIRVSTLDGVDALTLEDIPAPTPGVGEVRVKVYVGGVNFPDLLMSEGKYQHKPKLPFTPGLEAAGEVIDVGEGVTRFKPGDRVMGFFDYGAFAEEAVIAEKFLMHVPSGMSWEMAGGFCLTHTTSHAALVHERVNLKNGEVLLVHGAAGGVGTTAVQIGKALGCTVVATAGSDDKAQFALDNGADYAINYSTEEIRTRVKELVGGADVIYDPVSGDAFTQSLRCINFEGRIIIIGFASGIIANAPANYVLVKNISIVGFPVGSYRRTSPEVLLNSYDGLSKMWDAGQLQPQQSHVFSLSEAGEAIKALRDRKAKGKVIIKVRDGE